jgi:hypothetical protein
MSNNPVGKGALLTGVVAPRHSLLITHYSLSYSVMNNSIMKEPASATTNISNSQSYPVLFDLPGHQDC